MGTLAVFLLIILIFSVYAIWITPAESLYDAEWDQEFVPPDDIQ